MMEFVSHVIFDFLGCYNLLSPGRKLTNSNADFQLETVSSCQDKCDSIDEFECIAYSFG